MRLLIASPVITLILRCTPYLRGPVSLVHRQAHACMGTYSDVSVRLTAILIVISLQPWYELKGRPWQNLEHQRQPPLDLQVACLFGGAQAFGASGKGIGEAVWIPGWNEFDGLIVAPSGHRHTSQRAGRAGEQRLEKYSLHYWIFAHGPLLPLI